MIGIHKTLRFHIGAPSGHRSGHRRGTVRAPSGHRLGIDGVCLARSFLTAFELVLTSRPCDTASPCSQRYVVAGLETRLSRCPHRLNIDKCRSNGDNIHRPKSRIRIRRCLPNNIESGGVGRGQLGGRGLCKILSIGRHITAQHSATRHNMAWYK